MKQLRVKDLKKFVDEAIDNGYGDRYIVVSDDNEGNGYHGMFFQFSTDHLENYVNLIGDSKTNDPTKFVVLG